MTSKAKDKLTAIKATLSKVVTVLDLESISEHYVPTPVSVLNKHLGGGFMTGKINVLAGLPHTGKTTMAAQLAAKLLSENEDSLVVYFDTENAVRKDRLISLGVDTDRLIYATYDVTLESIFSSIDSLIEYKISEGLEDVPYLCIWDTLAFTPSEAMLSSDEFQNTDEMVYSKLLKKYFVKYAGQLNKYNIQLLIINQLRTKIQNMNKFQPTYEIDIEGMKYNMPGGSMLKFAAFQLVIFTNTTSDIEKKRKEENKKDTEDSVFKHLTTVKATILKNKSGDTLIEENIIFDKQHGFSELWTSYLYLKQKGIIEVKGGWQYIKDTDIKFRIKELENLYNTDDKFREEYNKAIKKYILEEE